MNFGFLDKKDHVFQITTKSMQNIFLSSDICPKLFVIKYDYFRDSYKGRQGISQQNLAWMFNPQWKFPTETRKRKQQAFH